MTLPVWSELLINKVAIGHAFRIQAKYANKQQESLLTPAKLLVG